VPKRSTANPIAVANRTIRARGVTAGRAGPVPDLQ